MPDFSPLTDDRLIAAESGLHTMFAKARDAGADTESLVLTHEDVASELRSRGLIYEPLAKADHSFAPVRNVCKTCRQPGPPAHDQADHDFVPVRNVCKGCGQGSDAHADMQKAVDDAALVSFIKSVDGPDAFELIEKALPELSMQERQQMAQTGVALPDGSFPIPNEAFLHAAIRLVGQAPDPQTAMNHIIERAKAMGLESALPPAWNTADPSQPGSPQLGDGAHTLAPKGAAQPARASGASPAAGGGNMSQPGGGAAAGGGAAGGSMAGGMTGGAGTGAASGGNDANGGLDPTDPNKKMGLAKRMAKALADVMGASFDEDTFSKELAINLEPEFECAFVKAVGEKRLTLGPVYMPGQLDAHDEWTTADDLESAVIDYVKSCGADRSIYLQHSDKPAGEWVSIMAWPHPVSATMTKSIDGVQKSTTTEFPAGTVYMGVQWSPWAWEMVKANKITGFSMGGFSRRLEGAPA